MNYDVNWLSTKPESNFHVVLKYTWLHPPLWNIMPDVMSVLGEFKIKTTHYPVDAFSPYSKKDKNANHL